MTCFYIGSIAHAQTNSTPNSGPRIEFEETEHVFGTFWQTNYVECEFVFKNTGTETLHIKKVQAACGCTSPKVEPESVLPGKTGKVIVRYSPTPGPFSKNITVKSNAIDNPRVVLKIKGEVKEKFKITNRDGKYGMTDITKGEICIPFIYDFLQIIWADTCIIAKKNGLRGIIDFNNNSIIPFEYQDIVKHSGITGISIPHGYTIYSGDDYINLKKNDKWGVLNKKGKVIIPFLYDIPVCGTKKDGNDIDSYYTFLEGRAKVKKDGKWGVIDKENNIIETFK